MISKDIFPGMQEPQEIVEPAAEPERNVEEEVAEVIDEERDEAMDEVMYENAAVLIEEPEQEEPVIPMQERNVQEEVNLQVPVEVPIKRRPTRRAGRNGSMYNLFWKVMIF